MHSNRVTWEKTNTKRYTIVRSVRSTTQLCVLLFLEHLSLFSLKSYLCLQLAINSDLILRQSGSLFFMMISFSCRHTSQVLLPGLQRGLFSGLAIFLLTGMSPLSPPLATALSNTNRELNCQDSQNSNIKDLLGKLKWAIFYTNGNGHLPINTNLEKNRRVCTNTSKFSRPYDF